MKNKVLILLLAFSLLVCLVPIARRVKAEGGNNEAVLITEYSSGMEDCEALLNSKAAVFSLRTSAADEETAKRIKAKGCGLVLVNDSLSIGQWLALSEKLGADLKLYIAKSCSEEELSFLSEKKIPLALTENETRTGSDVTGGREYYGAAVKLLDTAVYADRYGVLGYEGAEEIENIIFRAVTDRGIRAVLLSDFTENPEEYAKMALSLEKRLARRGVELSNGFSQIEYIPESRVLISLICIGIGAALLLLLQEAVSLGPKMQAAVLCVWQALCILLAVLNINLLQKLASLAAATALPCLAYVLFIKALVKSFEKESSFLQTGKTFLLCIFVSMLGGVYVGAIMGTSRYIMEFDLFSGVKLSQAAPMLWAAFYMYKKLFKEERLRIKGVKKYTLPAMAAVLLIAVFVYMGRLGDGFLSVSVLEQRARNLIEELLYVRPRTKEFLAAFPALVLALYFGRKTDLIWIFAFLPVIGFASAANTFCHIRAGFMQSVIRTGISAALGFVIGYGAAVLAEKLVNNIKRKKYGKQQI